MISMLYMINILFIEWSIQEQIFYFCTHFGESISNFRGQSSALEAQAITKPRLYAIQMTPCKSNKNFNSCSIDHWIPIPRSIAQPDTKDLSQYKYSYHYLNQYKILTGGLALHCTMGYFDRHWRLWYEVNQK